MLTGKYKEVPSWMSALNNKDFYKKKPKNAPLLRLLETVSKTRMILPLLILLGSIKDLSIMMKNSKTLKEKDAKPISSSSNI